MNIPSDAVLGSGFAPYSLDENDKLKPFYKNRMYYYPLVSDDKICGLMIVTVQDDGHMSYQAGRDSHFEGLNDIDSDIDHPITVVVNSGHYAYMDGDVVAEWVLPPYDTTVFEHTGDVLRSGNVKYAKRSYNIAVQSTNELSYNISDADDDFYSLNGSIYRIVDGSFAHGWQKHGRYIYYFGSDGRAYTGKRFIGDTLYLFSESGIYRRKFSGKYTDAAGTRYFKNGKLLTGQFKVNGRRIKTDSSGYVIE